MTARRYVAFAVTASMLAALVAGCASSEPKIVSFWPRADKERTVPKPAEPPRWPLTGARRPRR